MVAKEWGVVVCCKGFYRVLNRIKQTLEGGVLFY